MQQDDKELNIPTTITAPLLGLWSARFLRSWHIDMESLDDWML